MSEQTIIVEGGGTSAVFNVLIVEGDKKCSSNYRSYLEKHGYAVAVADDADEAMRIFQSTHIDIVLSAVNLSGVDGAMLAGAIREIDLNVPIMMLTSRGDISSMRRAYAVEIDDYMIKPIDLNELSLRMTALLRRAHAVSKRQVVLGNALLDADTFSVTVADKETILPPKEFMVLFKLCSTPGRVFSRRDIMSDIWGVNSDSDERTVDVHIKRLRDRFASDPGFSIETVRGIGYKAVVA